MENTSTNITIEPVLFGDQLAELRMMLAKTYCFACVDEARHFADMLYPIYDKCGTCERAYCVGCLGERCAYCFQFVCVECDIKSWRFLDQPECDSCHEAREAEHEEQSEPAGAHEDFVARECIDLTSESDEGEPETKRPRVSE